MRCLVIFLLPFAVACAAGGSAVGDGSSNRAPAEVMPAGGGLFVRLADDSRPVTENIAAEPEEVWSALIDAYREIDIAPVVVDRSSWTIGNPERVANRTLAGTNLAEYLDCGRGVYGPIASTHRILLAVVTRLEPAGDDRTRMLTRVRARAQNREGNRDQLIQCRSTGALEEKLAAAVREASAS